MKIETPVLAGLGAVIGTTFLKRESDARQAAERLAAAGMEALLNAIDANDGQTGAHVRRVASYALTLGDAADLGEDEMRLIEQVALFHDIGKIHEALFDIIHDARRLSPAERREVSTHPAKGAEVLRPFHAFYPNLMEGVLSHHERWNGTGYPRRLKGQRIPLAARVVAIADSYDAITWTRRYHRGASPAFARNMIIAGRGTQFDPDLADLFVFPPVFEKILETQRRVSSWRAPVRKRLRGHLENHVPEITFRWRPESREGRVRKKRD